MTTILLLAAGASTRMGQSKQRLTIEGEPLLVRSVKAALAAGHPVVVVLGADAEAHEELLHGLPVQLVRHDRWQQGMGSSLKAGLRKILSSPHNVNAVLVMLCDQPKVTAAHLRALTDRAAQTGRGIVASAYSQSLGVPAVFKSDLFPDLLSIDDAAGAAKLIRRQPDNVEPVEFPDGAVDLDTPEDVARFTGRPRP